MFLRRGKGAAVGQSAQPFRISTRLVRAAAVGQVIAFRRSAASRRNASGYAVAPAVPAASTPDDRAVTG
jgi:hypothetical protein